MDVFHLHPSVRRGDLGIKADRLAVLPPHDNEHLSELSVSLLINYAEYHRQECLLPQFQFYPLRCKFSLMMMAELFNEHHRCLCLFVVIKKGLVFKSLDYVFIYQPHPFGNLYSSVLDLLIVCKYVVIHLTQT